jgi:branched-chain amino acid transport system ATP-binding protein
MLDEPSLGLAPIVVDELFQAIRSINGLGVTILLVEQNVLQALEMADRAYVLETGRVVLEGPARELAESSSLKAAFLGL